MVNLFNWGKNSQMFSSEKILWPEGHLVVFLDFGGQIFVSASPKETDAKKNALNLPLTGEDLLY